MKLLLKLLIEILDIRVLTADVKCIWHVQAKLKMAPGVLCAHHAL